MSQNLPKRSLVDFLFYVILTISYLTARTIETSSYHAAPVQANRDFFLHTDCVFHLIVSTFLIYARAATVPPRDFVLLGEIPAGAIKRMFGQSTN